MRKLVAITVEVVVDARSPETGVQIGDHDVRQQIAHVVVAWTHLHVVSAGRVQFLVLVCHVRNRRIGGEVCSNVRKNRINK